MTSMPASRSARATTFAPRSWPSRPGFATTTRIGTAARLLRDDRPRGAPTGLERDARARDRGAGELRHSALLDCRDRGTPGGLPALGLRAPRWDVRRRRSGG